MKLFAQKDAEEFAKTGAREFRYNRDIRLTPGAKDVFSEASIKLVFDAEAKASATAASSSSSAATTDDAKIFNSPEAEKLKKEICDIGRRIWMREYCDGNGGNISAKLAPNRFIITPTGVSKGFMTPEMMSMVDIDGKQLAGTWKRSSEFTTHAAIYSTTPDAASV